jgi:hypothetical protein
MLGVRMPVADRDDDRPECKQHREEQREEDGHLATLTRASPPGALVGGG